MIAKYITKIKDAEDYQTGNSKAIINAIHQKASDYHIRYAQLVLLKTAVEDGIINIEEAGEIWQKLESRTPPQKETTEGVAPKEVPKTEEVNTSETIKPEDENSVSVNEANEAADKNKKKYRGIFKSIFRIRN